MKTFILVLLVVSSLYSDQYVFLLDKSDTEKEYEAKIISKIASASLQE